MTARRHPAAGSHREPRPEGAQLLARRSRFGQPRQPGPSPSRLTTRRYGKIFAQTKSTATDHPGGRHEDEALRLSLPKSWSAGSELDARRPRHHPGKDRPFLRRPPGLCRRWRRRKRMPPIFWRSRGHDQPRKSSRPSGPKSTTISPVAPAEFDGRSRAVESVTEEYQRWRPRSRATAEQIAALPRATSQRATLPLAEVSIRPGVSTSNLRKRW